MTSQDIKNKFIIFNIQRNYKFLSKYLTSFQDHINICYDSNIITLYQRNIIIGKIYELIKELNSSYNKFIINKIEDNCNILDKYLDINLDNYDDLTFFNARTYLKNLFNLTFRNDINTILYPLDSKRIDIIKLSEKYGCINIKSILEILLKLELKVIYSEYTNIYINFLNKIFLPLKFNITNDIFKKIPIEQNEYIMSENSDDDETDYNLSKYVEDINIYIKPINNNDELLNRIVCIEIKYYNKTILIEGTFIQDSINIYIKTCQISNKFLYYKKKILETKLDKCRATKKFSKSFFKTLTTFEILSYNNDFISFIDNNYDKYMVLIGKSFMNIMKDFIKKNNTITDMYTTIRLLLLGNEENINIAGLLFEITKEKKINSYLIYDIIYKHLNYVSQIKLKKTISIMKDELKNIQSMTSDDIDFKKQILSLKNMPLNVKGLALEKVEEMKSSNNEYYKQLQYVKTIIKFPWPSPNDDLLFHELNNHISRRKHFISSIENKLTNLTYGHKEAKSSLLQIIGKWITNPNSGGSVISLVGPPGVGKTLLAKSVSEVLNIPFAQITLGGQNDGELLHGHGYTYSGSQPGMIIKKMVEVGKSRCILYFDELDKACSKNGSNEITSILIHLTDPNMNKTFQDRFFQGVDFPLDKVIMIFSYNDSSLIDPILLDRFKQIQTKAYSVNDKLNIAKKFMFNELCTLIGFNVDDFEISDDVIKYIIDKYTYEAGVRDLKRKLENILLNLNVDRLYQRGIFSKNVNKIIITEKIVIDILEKPMLEIQKIHKDPLIGVINGLYATTNGGGGIVPIQIFSNFFNSDTPFSLRLTGCQGDVMKESVQCSLTCAIDHISNNLEKYGIDNLKEYLEKKWKSGFHVHAPSGATPKDGPSAGCAFTTAFISRILERKINNKVAMTGEIDLLGFVTKIGGLEFKINGAKKAGVTKILISRENEKDYNQIKKDDPELFNNMEIIFVDTINDIIPHTLLN
jgi:endopeptidase La